MKKKKILTTTLWIGAMLAMFTFAFNPFVHPLSVDGPWQNAMVDQTGFAYMGKMWMQGVIPYRDIFDQKGPLLFLINGIGQVLSPNSMNIGFYISLLPLKALELYFIKKIIDLYVNNEVKSYFYSSVIFIGSLVTTLGATCEEFMTPFMVIALYVGIKTYKEKDQISNKQVYINSGIIGAMVASVLMIRVNNALFGLALLPLLLGTLGLNPKTIIRAILSAFIGFLLVIMPFTIYFALNGALSEFIEGVLLFSMNYSKYAVDFRANGFINGFLHVINSNYYIFILTNIILFICFFKKSDKYLLSFGLLLSLIQLFIMNMGLDSVHYTYVGYIVAIPMIVILLELKLDKALYILTTTLLALFTLNIIPVTVDLLVTIDIYNEMRVETRLELDEVIDYVGEEVEEMQLFSADGYFYYITNTVPNNRYWAWEAQWIDIFPEICDQITETLVEDSPRFVYASRSVADKYCPSFMEYINDNYEPKINHEYHSLYEKKQAFN